MTNLISRIEFVTLVSYKFIPNTDFYFLTTYIFDASRVCVNVTTQKITRTTHAQLVVACGLSQEI